MIRGILRILALLVFVAVFITGIAVGDVAHRTYKEFLPLLTSKNAIVNLGNRGVVLLDRNGRQFFTFYHTRHINYAPLSVIPFHLQEAVLAMEDHRFLGHPGFSLPGIARAVILDVQHNAPVHGGSTITQQLVKNTLLSPTKSYYRKFEEIVGAVAVERHFSKGEILEMYLNTAYFGRGATGVENAAQYYFGKPASELTKEESYFLVALLPSPSTLVSDEARLKERQRLIVFRLRTLGLISEREQQAFVPLAVRPGSETELSANTTGVHFALMVKEQLVRLFGEEALVNSGFIIKTTLDLDKQAEAERIVREGVVALESLDVSNAAAVVLDPASGEILALVGSRDWHEPHFGRVNMAVTPRQPGSAFKPLVYATAFERAVLTPASILNDRPTTFEKEYRPLNYDGRFRGKVSVRQALATSLNVPAVQAISQVGVDNVITQARKLGITTLQNPANYGLSLALGAGEVSLLQLTSAYGAFASNGIHTGPVSILEMHDKVGRPLVVERPMSLVRLSRGAAFLITSILADDGARKEMFGDELTLARPAAVKTGTTEHYRDAWTIGFTPHVVVGVWVGNNDNAPMREVAGALGAAPTWKKLMNLFTDGSPAVPFEIPQGVLALTICPHNGLLLKHPSRRGATEYFIDGTQPQEECSFRPSLSPVLLPQPQPILVQEQTGTSVLVLPEKASEQFLQEESNLQEEDYEDSS